MNGPCTRSNILAHSHALGAPLIALAWLVCPAALLRADDVYKSVDAEGHVVYSDRPSDSPSQASLVHIEGTAQAPPVLHFCWTNCFTLVLNQGVYTRADGTDETWTVERFTPSEFVLHRHDAPVAWNRFSRDVVYRGQITNERLTNVTVNGAAVRDIQMAWGDALATLPGSNAERDQRLAQLQQASASAVATPAIAGDMLANEPPPPLPDDEPPAAPADGYFWTPGYWAWDGGGYQWVTGTWISPPQVGLFWTPGYWAFTGTAYAFHRGYWGPHVGFYGGINYGYGYPGVGFTGGHWVGNSFAYDKNIGARSAHNVSFNGGPGVSPTAAAISNPGIANTPPVMAVRSPVRTPIEPARTSVEPARTMVASSSSEIAHRSPQAAISTPAPKPSRTTSMKSPSPPKP